MYWLSVKSTLGQNCQMFVNLNNTAPCSDQRERNITTGLFGLDVCQYEGKKKPSGIKLQYFCQYGDRKKTNQRTKLSIYILDTIESESTTRFKNRLSDRMMMSDWLVDVSDDRYTTTWYKGNMYLIKHSVIKSSVSYRQL
jgi:hypothetical protein